MSDGRKQVIQLRIQVLGGWIPRLQKKIVEAGLIDGADRGVRIRISREQSPLRRGKDSHRLLQKFHTVHARHALVGQQQGNAVIAHFQLLQQIERPFGRIASYDPVFSAVLRTQIALDRPQHIGVVIYAQQNRFRHSRSRFEPSGRETSANFLGAPMTRLDTKT
jgi:hypothetical protein